jgi:hypothetical protein
VPRAHFGYLLTPPAPPGSAGDARRQADPPSRHQFAGSKRPDRDGPRLSSRRATAAQIEGGSASVACPGIHDVRHRPQRTQAAGSGCHRAQWHPGNGRKEPASSCQRAIGRRLPGEPGTQPAAGSTAVCPLPVRIVLSYLTYWYNDQDHKIDCLDARSHSIGTLPPAGYVLRLLYIGPAVVTCLKICCSPSRLPASGQGPSSYSRSRAGCPATQCERGSRP